jgi:hypothetical protein
MLKVLCPHCHHVLAISKVQPGALAQCPFCTGRFRIPAVHIMPPAPPVPSPAPPGVSILLPPAPLPTGATPPRALDSGGGVFLDPLSPDAPVEPLPQLELGKDDDFEVIEQEQAEEGDQFEVVEVEGETSSDDAEEWEIDEEATAKQAGSPPIDPTPEGQPVAEEQLGDMLQAEPAVRVPAVEDALAADPIGERRKRRRRRRPQLNEEEEVETGGGHFPSEIIPGLDNFVVLLMIVVALWILLGVLAFFAPPVALALIVLGVLLAAAGQIWFLIVAFQEDITAGILCLFVPFYALIFLVTNLEVAGRPFAVNVLGFLMFVSGLMVIFNTVGFN